MHIRRPSARVLLLRANPRRRSHRPPGRIFLFVPTNSSVATKLSPAMSFVCVSSLAVRRGVGHGDGPVLDGGAAAGAVPAVRAASRLRFPRPHVRRPVQPLDAHTQARRGRPTYRILKI